MQSTITTRDFIVAIVVFLLGLGVGIAISPKGNLVDTPLNNFGIYLCGFNIDENKKITTNHRYMNELMYGKYQSIIFNSTKKGAKVIGIEYTISDYYHKELPNDEKQFWHPNSYNVSSGLLVMPKIGTGEYVLVNKWMPTWSRTFYTWADPLTDLPKGYPALQRPPLEDGEVNKNDILMRDLDVDVNSYSIKKERKNRYYPSAKPYGAK